MQLWFICSSYKTPMICSECLLLWLKYTHTHTHTRTTLTARIFLLRAKKRKEEKKLHEASICCMPLGWFVSRWIYIHINMCLIYQYIYYILGICIGTTIASFWAIKCVYYPCQRALKHTHTSKQTLAGCRPYPYPYPYRWLEVLPPEVHWIWACVRVYVCVYAFMRKLCIYVDNARDDDSTWGLTRFTFVPAPAIDSARAAAPDPAAVQQQR